jgi:large subunit ribosomal protein L25
LNVQIRKELGKEKAKKIRAADNVPGIVYGGDAEPTPITMDRRNFERIMRDHRGQSVLFHLEVMEGEKKLREDSVILKDEQFHPVSEKVAHVDFQRVNLNEEIEVVVPVEAKGEAVGVKAGGTLEHMLWELDVVCLPLNIPEKIVVDVSNLNVNDYVLVKDIKLPEGVKTEHDPEATVFVVVHSMKEEAVAATEGESEEPEVIKKKAETPEAKKE